MKSNSSQKLYAAKTMAMGYSKDKPMEAEERVLPLGRHSAFMTSLHCAFSTPVSYTIETYAA